MYPTRLAPHGGSQLVQQIRLALKLAHVRVREAQPLDGALRRDVGWVVARDHKLERKHREGVVQHRRGRLNGVALSPVLGSQMEAELGILVVHPQADGAHKLVASMEDWPVLHSVLGAMP